MQTIENSLLQVLVDENGAQLLHLISKQKNLDYLKFKEIQKKIFTIFPGNGHEDNLAVELPWTVVDKGDSQVSLTLIDNEKSYRIFPYHFEIMMTYALEGNQLNISYHVINNSNKPMPYSLSLIVPKYQHVQEEINSLALKDEDRQLMLKSTSFNFKSGEQVSCISGKLELAGKEKQDLTLSLTVS